MLKQVEMIDIGFFLAQPPSGGCVLKLCRHAQQQPHGAQPPSGGCVLKHVTLHFGIVLLGSRLRAAVC